MPNPTQSLPIQFDPLVTKAQSDTERSLSEYRSARFPLVAGYTLHEPLGEGGMGIVYKATQLKLNRTVALKMIHGGRTAGPKEIIRFLAEAEAVAAIDHPHVVKVFDTGDAGGHPYLAMEYLPGGSLSERLKKGRLDPLIAADLIRKLALAVQAAHDRQIVHRDLKPSNIMFDANNEPRILDFGLAKKDGGGLTQTNAIMGTAAYMAPEQARGENKFVGPQADVWALGVIFYECLTGVRPFSGSNDLEIIRKVVDEHPSRMRSRLAAIPKDQELIVEKCLAKDPTGRYPTAAALAEELRRWLAGEPVSVKAAGPIERSAKWVKRNKLAAGIMLASGLGTVAATTLAIIAFRESQRADLAVQQANNDSALAHYEAQKAEAETRSAIAANAELLAVADERQFALSFPKIAAKHVYAMHRLNEIIDAKLPGDAEDEEIERLAKQQANAAVALLRLNTPEKVWPLLKHSSDPRLRSYLIHRMAPLGVDPKVIIARLNVETEISIRRALILSLGEFDEKEFPLNDRPAFLPKLLEMYRNDSDPGLHSAVEWLLHTWKQELWIRQVNDGWARNPQASGGRKPPGSGAGEDKNRGPDTLRSPGWYVNGQGQTMIALPGPMEFVMGSPESETPHFENEQQHTMHINRSFAIGAKAVTLAQFRRFDAAHAHSQWIGELPELPVVDVTWYQAAAYCNWLSQQESIPKEQWCYETDDQGKIAKIKSNYLKLAGYRLPTEAELEYATRAESRTSRFYGESSEILHKYAWYDKNSKGKPEPVGGLKPNDFGLFDALGNSWAWCQESYKKDYSTDVEGTFIDVNDPEFSVVARGGGVERIELVRSAYRNYKVKPSYKCESLGFRLVRTILP